MNRLRKHPAYRSITRILLVGLIVVGVFQLARLPRTTHYDSPGTTDLVAYWTAGQLLLAGENPFDHERLYELQRELGSQDAAATSVWNPPWLLVWILPLLLLSFPVAAVLWLVVNFGLIVGCGTLAWRTLAGPATSRQMGWAWVATVTFVPTLFTLRMGQVSSIVLLGVVGFMYFRCRDRDFLAGLFLALTTIKPHLVYLLWIVVAWSVITERRWKIVAGAASLLVPTVGLLVLAWPASIAGYQSVLQQPPLLYAAPTLGVVLRLVAFNGAAGTQFLVSLVAGLSVLAYLLVRRPVLDWRAIMSPLLLLSVTTAAYGWSFDYIVLLVPYIQVVIWLAEGDALAGREKTLVLAALVVVAGVMIIQNKLQSNDLFYVWVPWAIGVVYLYGRTSALRGQTPAPQQSRLAALSRSP